MNSFTSDSVANDDDDQQRVYLGDLGSLGSDDCTLRGPALGPLFFDCDFAIIFRMTGICAYIFSFHQEPRSTSPLNICFIPSLASWFSLWYLLWHSCITKKLFTSTSQITGSGKRRYCYGRFFSARIASLTPERTHLRDEMAHRKMRQEENFHVTIVVSRDYKQGDAFQGMVRSVFCEKEVHRFYLISFPSGTDLLFMQRDQT